jgi:hypothetical protein
MPRIRSIKPAFWTNEVLAELSPWHRLCFIGLWNQADREGRLEDRPRKLKAEIFPFDEVDMDALLTGLAAKGFITRYVADGAAYIAVVHFRRHQRPASDEKISAIPAPLFDQTRVFHQGDLLGEGEGEGNGEGHGEGNGEGDGKDADGAPPAADGADIHLARAADFAEAWNRLTEPPIPRCRDLTSARKRHIRVRLTERPLTEWEDVIRRIQASAFCRGDNDRGWRATIDWLVGSPDVAVKVLEGKYDDAPRRGPMVITGSLKTAGNQAAIASWLRKQQGG